MSVESLYQKGNDEYCTPDWLKKGLFKGWYDPCPINAESMLKDSLASSWPSCKLFINPPYSNPLPWVIRGIAESRKGKTVAFLLKFDSSTVWFSKLLEAGGHIMPIIGRLHFNNMKGPAPFPSVIVLLYPENL